MGGWRNAIVSDLRFATEKGFGWGRPNQGDAAAKRESRSALYASQAGVF